MLRFTLIAAIVLLVSLTELCSAEKDWWENGNLYQIYPRSFKDSDGDGIGDLNGITENVQYLKNIGMDGIWLSPIFKSPMADFGYDISDYYSIQPEYGTVDDLRNLLEKVHSLGLKLILDFVPNHTSDEHEWFIKSVNGDPAYRDFYIWHDGVVNAETGERQPPSNWISQFRYSAWEWNESRQQYYLHQFAVKQPDLNFRSPAVRQALNDVLSYWMAQGIDGFRIDAVPFFFEVEIDPETGTYPDEPRNAQPDSCPDPNDYCYLNHPFTNSLKENIEVIYDWRDLLDEWKREHNSDTKILLTEAYTSFENLMLLYGNGERNGAHVSFNFEMLAALNNRSSADDYKYYVQHWLNNMPSGAYANWVLGNHDNTRLATRFGQQRTDLINIFLQTLPGIAVTYNGEEYGQESVDISWEDTVDPQGCNTAPDSYEKYSRDPVRTPFRWDSSKNAGFSNADHTWLPVGEGYEENNIAAQLALENSHLKIFQRIVGLRRTEPAFDDGSFEVQVVDEILMYKRQSSSGDAFIVILNIGGADRTLDLTQHYNIAQNKVEVVVSSLQSEVENGQKVSSNSFEVKKYVGYVVRVLN